MKRILVIVVLLSVLAILVACSAPAGAPVTSPSPVPTATATQPTSTPTGEEIHRAYCPDGTTHAEAVGQMDGQLVLLVEGKSLLLNGEAVDFSFDGLPQETEVAGAIVILVEGKVFYLAGGLMSAIPCR